MKVVFCSIQYSITEWENIWSLSKSIERWNDISFGTYPIANRIFSKFLSFYSVDFSNPFKIKSDSSYSITTLMALLSY